MLTTYYCECTDCKYHNGIGCGADFTTIDINGVCLGSEEK